MKRTVVGLIIVCAILVWAVSPVFLGSLEHIITLTVNPSTNSDCPTESACFTLELQNRGPWPIAIDIIELKFYPSLIGPSVNVNYSGSGPDKSLMLMPFTGQTYTFSIKIMGGFHPPDRVYVVLAGNVTVLYVSHYVVYTAANASVPRQTCGEVKRQIADHILATSLWRTIKVSRGSW